jgi:hypothetical protein
VAALRLHLLLGTVLIAAAGCASQPARTDNNVTTPASSGAVSAPASADSASTAASIKAMKSAVSPGLLMFAHDQGYTQVVIRGNKYSFCKSEAEIGELIATRQCLDQAQMESLRVRVQQQQQDFTRQQAAQTRTLGH